MPKKSYTGKLTRAEVLELFIEGRYLANIETGKVFNSGGRELYTFTNQQSSHRWVRLFKHPKYKCVPISHIIWMVATNSVVPEGWEVHHIDTDTTHDAFNNLMCLHPNDHRKLHRALGLVEAPF